MRKVMKLADWAHMVGIPYNTAWKWFKNGKLNVPAYKSKSGAIYVEDEVNEEIKTQPTSNVALSMFLTKTIECIRDNTSIEEFANFIITNFQLKLNDDPADAPKSITQSYFQQFFPKQEEMERLKTTKTKLEIENIVKNSEMPIIVDKERVKFISDCIAEPDPITYTNAYSTQKENK